MARKRCIADDYSTDLQLAFCRGGLENGILGNIASVWKAVVKGSSRRKVNRLRPRVAFLVSDAQNCVKPSSYRYEISGYSSPDFVPTYSFSENQGPGLALELGRPLAFHLPPPPSPRLCLGWHKGHEDCLSVWAVYIAKCGLPYPEGPNFHQDLVNHFHRPSGFYLYLPLPPFGVISIDSIQPMVPHKDSCVYVENIIKETSSCMTRLQLLLEMYPLLF